MPGRVEGFDAATQTADVLPLQRQTDSVNGSDVATAFPVLPAVPVAFAGGGGYATTYPVTKGDPCWLVFGDWSLEEWYFDGGVVTPLDLRLHGVNGAVALLGVRAQPQALTEFDSSRAVFGARGPRVACDGSAVHLGVAHQESATQAVVRGDVHLQALKTLLDALDVLLRTGTNGGGLVTFEGTPLYKAARAAFDAALHTTPKVKVP